MKPLVLTLAPHCSTVKSAVASAGAARIMLFESGSGSVVEHLLAKEGVAGSNPVFRSIFLLETTLAAQPG
jgi:hypothetical protein